jgi:PAS domain S-box-containing protein
VKVSLDEMLCRLEPGTLRLLKVTPSVEEFFGQTADQLRRRGFLDCLHPDDRTLAEEEIRKACEIGESHDFVVRSPDASGRVRHVRVYTQARYNPDATLNHIRCYFKNVTERVHAEQELRRQTGQLSAVNEQLREQTRQLTAENVHLRLLNERLRRSEANTDLGCEHLAHYQVLEVIGQGGMGVVYKAMHTVMGRIVAMKVLTACRREDPEAAARFHREMRVVGKLNHPIIVQGIDAGESDGLLFLIMDYVEGIDLSRLVSLRGPLPVPVACELIRQAAVGLQHIHEHGLLHRDLKPSNLMVTTTGQVKLLDLGLARLYDGSPDAEELTLTGQIVGTADYIAPEQGRNSRAIDIRADLYSLGCTLFKLLTGQAPFSGPEYQTVLEKLLAHAQTPPPPVQRYRPDVPEALATTLSRLLAKDPGDRYHTPAEVSDALVPFAAACDLRGFLGQVGATMSRPAGMRADSPCTTETFGVGQDGLKG